MSRQLLLPLLLVLSWPALAQRIAVSGTAIVLHNPRNGVRVVVNDTVRKFQKSTLRLENPDFSGFEKLVRDYSFFVKEDGRFRVEARPADSLYFEGYHTIRQAYQVADLLKRPAINIVLQPAPCLPYVPCRDSLPRHYVFIGEKIRVEATAEPYYCNRISMDSKYTAEYKVLANVYGHLPHDTIRFSAYDHYGRPAFSKKQVVLLFVSEYCQELIHEKYQYFPLYKTADNRWAAPYPALTYASLPAGSGTKPHRLKFREPVVIDITGNDPDYVARTFPAPYYRIENNQAIAIYGNYVDELVELSKQTVLKARGIILR
ncbi:MAG: hypothetical protein JWP58_2882 [Hymenobacter sp.]|nr:hypothetical protein [Hymenobacter sp.]